MKKLIIKYKLLLACLCTLILTLNFEKSWSMEKDHNKTILSCVPPTKPHEARPKKLVGAEFFNNAKAVFQPGSQPGLITAPLLTAILERPGKKGDGRRIVSETEKFPYSAQVYFVTEFYQSPKGTREIGSGTFIYPRVILTAAHVVYSREYGCIYKSLQCIPAANNGLAPFGTVCVKGVKICNNYMNYPNFSKYSPDDYALVFLHEPKGQETGYFGIDIPDDEVLAKLSLNIFGYPGEKLIDGKIERPTMWGMSGYIDHIGYLVPDHLYYNIDTTNGQSGSGIWYHKGTGDKPEYYLVGVHTYGPVTPEGSNYGTRLTKSRVAQIRQWIQEFEEKTLKLDNEVLIAKLIQESNTTHKFSSKIKVLFGEEALPLETLEKAKTGDRKAQYEIGLLYANGQGVSQDDEDALNWIRLSAQQNYPKALFKLGVMYEYAQGVLQNASKAFKWYQRAAAAGKKEAQLKLGKRYEYGQGTLKDLGRAFKWYQKSAQQGNKEAHLALKRVEEIIKNKPTQGDLESIGVILFDHTISTNPLTTAVSGNNEIEEIENTNLQLFKLGNAEDLKTAQTLDLRDKKLEDAGAMLIVRYISQNTTLTSLDVEWNQIGASGAEALAKLSGLTSLDVRWNQIGDAGAKALAKLTGLTSLSVGNNQIGATGKWKLEKLSNLGIKVYN
ncbi:MAG: SEL1-like repeat protein [Candidatus Paracaedibacteraceae bacterium]|nr:SEL1-like repeat protein [Candidatus Paracaedibacteraceae bacterium]